MMSFDSKHTGSKQSVVIIEDDSSLRETYSLIINSSERFEIVGVYESCEKAFDLIERSIPDIALVDVELPGMSGIEGIKVIKDTWPQIEVIVFTVCEDEEIVFEALKAGASGYITKGVSFTELLAALDEILRGGAPMSSKIARMVVNSYRLSITSPLSNRERQILSRLASGKTYSQIAEELFISKETSRTHIRNIYLKLKVNSKAEAIEKASKDRFI